MLYGAYALVRSIRHGAAAVAAQNAGSVIQLERAAHLFHEQAVQRLSDHVFLAPFVLAVLYPGLHAVGTLALL